MLPVREYNRPEPSVARGEICGADGERRAAHGGSNGGVGQATIITATSPSREQAWAKAAGAANKPKDPTTTRQSAGACRGAAAG